MISELEKTIGKKLSPSEFAEFYFDWHPFVYQKPALDSKQKRLLLVWGRQAGKSTTIAVRALYEAMWNDGILVIIVSITQRQARELFDKIKNFINISARKLPQLKLTEMISRSTRLELEFWNGSKIVSLPGKADTIRGYTAGVVIVDEASRVEEEVFIALTPMLATTHGTLILISTPHGVNNYFYRAYAKPEMGFKTYHHPSASSPLIDRQTIEDEKENMTANEWAEEYLATFVDETDAFFPISLIDKCMATEKDNIGREIPVKAFSYYLSIDPARHGEDETAMMILEKTPNCNQVVKIIEKKGLNLVEIVNYALYLDRIWDFRRVVVDVTGLGSGVSDMLVDAGIPVEEVQFTIKSVEDVYMHANKMMTAGDIKFLYNIKLRKQLSEMKYEYSGNFTRVFHPDKHAKTDYATAFVLACWCLKKPAFNMFVDTVNGVFNR